MVAYDNENTCKSGEYSVKLLNILNSLDTDSKEINNRNIFAENGCTLDFKDEGDIIILVENGDKKCPKLVKAVNNNLVKSAQGFGEGGLAVALAISCVSGGLGVVIHMMETKPGDILLFEKSPNKIILTTEENNVAKLLRYLTVCGTSFTRLGTVGASELIINLYRAGCHSGRPFSIINVPVAELENKLQGEK